MHVNIKGFVIISRPHGAEEIIPVERDDRWGDVVQYAQWAEYDMGWPTRVVYDAASFGWRL